MRLYCGSLAEVWFLTLSLPAVCWLDLLCGAVFCVACGERVMHEIYFTSLASVVRRIYVFIRAQSFMTEAE